jgi:hypothetical protein
MSGAYGGIFDFLAVEIPLNHNCSFEQQVLFVNHLRGIGIDAIICKQSINENRPNKPKTKGHFRILVGVKVDSLDTLRNVVSYHLTPQLLKDINSIK